MTGLMPRGVRWLEVAAILALFLVIHVSANDTELATSADCYYNYNHYSEGDRILTNEPCLNCTCHNKMLMCYLKVCPFTKPIGQDCTIEKREDQCCPIITCPEVPVELDHSSAQSTDLATHQDYGCSIEGQFYPEGAQIPGNPKKPCELCYCIRNMTSCVMQECTLHVDGCRPIYNKGVCCPVRYDCARDEEIPLMLEDQTTTEAPSEGFMFMTTPPPAQTAYCTHNNVRYIDGELIEMDNACEHCYCMRGDIVCAVQECKPLEMHGKNCTARSPGPKECCPQVYECESDAQTTTLADEIVEPSATTIGYKDIAEPILTTTQGAVVSSEQAEKEAMTTEAARIDDTTSARIDESENEIHDKDYDHITAKPSRSNFTGQQSPESLNEHIEGEDTTTLLSKLDDIAATTILSESAPISDERITTVLPIVNQPQNPESTEGAGILSSLYTTMKSIVELATTLSPAEEEPQKAHDDEFLSNVIPGEGDCLDNGVSYANNTNVPTRNACEESCLCYNSIVQCQEVKCAPMPPNAENCKVMHEEGLCCPSYHCESMEFSTGTPPTHPAENQVIHREEGQHIEGSTLSQPSEIEQQTNGIDSSLDITTTKSAQAPISSKLDDTVESQPELITEAELIKPTDAPAIEESTEAKPHDQIPSDDHDLEEPVEHKLDAEPVQTEQPAKEEVVTEAATSKYAEADITTEAQIIKMEEKEVHKVNRIVHIQPASEQPTTQAAAEELPEAAPTTESPVREITEFENITDAPIVPEAPVDAVAPESTEVPLATDAPAAPEVPAVSEEVSHEEVTARDEIEATTQPQLAQEEITQTPQKVQEPIDISTAAPAEAQPEIQQIATTETAMDQKTQTESEISTEAHHEFNEIATESQPIGQPEEQKPEEQKPEEETPIIQQDEIVTTEQPLAQKEQQPEEISTETQPAVQPEQPSEAEIVTTEAAIAKAPEPIDVSTEAQHEDAFVTEAQEEQKQQENLTTQGPSSQEEMSSSEQPELPKHDEYITTEKIEQYVAPDISSTEHIEEKPLEPISEEMTTEKLAEEPVISEKESPVKQVALDSQVSSTEKQIEEQTTENTSENLIPDSSTDGHVEEHHDEISTEKHIELAQPVESVTTEQAVSQEATTQFAAQQPSEESLPQTTASTGSKLSDESQPAEEFQTHAPDAQAPIAQDITEKQPEYNEITSELIPLVVEDHHTEKDIFAPATETQQTVTEHIVPEVVETEEHATEGISSSEFTHIFGQESPATESPESKLEEQTTLSASKLNLGGISQTDFMEGEVITPDEKQELDVVENEAITTERLHEEQPAKQQPELPVNEIAQEPINTEQPAIVSHDEYTELAAVVADNEQVTTEKQYSESSTSFAVPSKQEDLDIVTEKVIPSKQEDLEIVTMRQEEPAGTPLPDEFIPEHHDIGFQHATESKTQAEPESTQSPSEVESTTFEQISEQKPAVEEATPSKQQDEEQQATTVASIAADKQHVEQATDGFEQSEQTTFGTVSETSTDASESKQEELIPTTEGPSKVDLQSGSQIHDEMQPELQESPVTTEAAKQEEGSATIAPSADGLEHENRIGEDQAQGTTQKSEEAQPIVTEQTISHREQPEQEQPHIPIASTEKNIIELSTLLSMIHEESTAAVTEISKAEEVTTQAQQQPAEKQPEELSHEQQTDQPTIVEAPIQHDEILNPIEEIATTEKTAVPAEGEASTQGAEQPAQFDETTDDHVQLAEIPAELSTEGPHAEEAPQIIESSSIHTIDEPSENQFQETTDNAIPLATDEPSQNEQTTKQQQEEEIVTETHVPAFVEPSKEEEIAPIAPETTTHGIIYEEPIKSKEPVLHDELPTEVSTEQHIDSAPEAEQPATQSPILDATTIKNVVDLLTTLHPVEPAIVQQEAATTQQPAEEHDNITPIYNRIDSESSSPAEQEVQTTESISAPVENKTSEALPTFATPPESANNIPLIREPMPAQFNEITTKLAESFDSTTLPSILFTSSHTERISDSTTIKNTQNEITEPTQQQITDGLPVEATAGAQHEPEPSQPTYGSSQPFDSGYGNVPSQYPDEEYTDEEEPTVFGPGTCRYGGKLYVSAQQIPRDDPCDFCFCFRSDIICLQQSCPPPINGCHEEPIQGFCCPRYECPVSMALIYNTTTTTTTTLPPYLAHFQRNSGKATRSGCEVRGQTYKIGERVAIASGPCIDCLCGGDGQMRCEPRVCSPEPMLRQMIASAKRR